MALSDGIRTSAKSMFTRQSSGLIRTAGAWDVLIFNIGLISVGAAIATDEFYGPAFYPGSNLFWATVLASLGSAIFVFAFWFWAITFPRAGGNYVFLTRSVGPGVGFSLSFVEACVSTIFGGLTALFFVTTALAPFFGTMAIITGQKWWSDAGSWMSTSNGTFAVGTVALIVASLLPLWGIRKYFLFQKILFVIALTGLAVGLVVLLVTSHTEFLGRLHNETGLTQPQVMKAAKHSGWVPTNNFDLGATIRVMIWPLAWVLAGLYSTGFGSEVRRVVRSQFFGMVGSVLVAGTIIGLYALSIDHTIGYNFMGAISWNSGSAPSASTSVAPFAPLLIAIGAGSKLAGILICLSFVAWFLFLIPAQLVYSQRVLMAWSFDGLMPAVVGWVSPRFRSPMVAIGITFVAALGFFALLVYGPLAKLVFVEGIDSVWCCVLALGVIFPWLRPQFFKQSPASKYYLGPIPLMSVVCLLGLAFGLFTLYLYLSDSLAAGHGPNQILPNIALLAGGIVVYLIMRAVRTSQGADVGVIYRELPIE